MSHLPVPVLFVEDDTSLRQGIAEYLSLQGFAVTEVDSGLAYYQAVAERDYAAVIIDLGLPDQPGEILIDYSRRNTQAAIVVLTARDTAETRVKSYQGGADLFVGKPVNLAELAAALHSLTERRSAQAADYGPQERRRSSLGAEQCPAVAADDLWVLAATDCCLIPPRGTAIKLTGKELAFLECFAASDNGKRSRADLLQLLYCYEAPSAHRALDALVRRLRKKVLADSGQALPLHTIYSEGYQFGVALRVES